MKITLPILLLLALNIQAQSYLYALGGTTTMNEDGYNWRMYEMYVPETVFDQSSAGFDQSWDISAFVAVPNQTKYYINTVPTADELLQFPNAQKRTTGSISTSQSTTQDSSEYFASDGLMSFVDSNFILDYTDHGDYGSFPQAYGDLHVDPIAGNYTYGDYSGTFAGTMITEVDAYGDMNTNEGSFEVTRLKTVQTLQLTYPGIGVVGTLSQTAYRYYREGDLWPFVKSTNNVLNVGLLGINSDTTQIEKAPANLLLSVHNPQLSEDLAIVPNPVVNEVDISAPEREVVSVVITDISGKEVFVKNSTSHLDLSALQAGTYLAKIQTSEGTSIKKIIKK